MKTPEKIEINGKFEEDDESQEDFLDTWLGYWSSKRCGDLLMGEMLIELLHDWTFKQNKSHE